MIELQTPRIIAGDPPLTSGGLLGPIATDLLLPRHRTYVETRGSTGAWLFRKPRSPVEVLNDSDGEVDNYCRVMSESETPVRTLERYASRLDARRIISLGGDNRIGRAVQFALSIEKATAMNARVSPKHRFPLEMEPAIQRLDRAVERLRGVQIEDKPVTDLLGRYDWSDAFFFCDERQTDWEDGVNGELATRLISVKGKVMLLTSHEPPWVEDRRNWNRVTSSAVTCELWVNY